VSIRDDADWQRFVTAIASPEWATDPALTHTEGRLAARESLDEHVATWTREHTKQEVAELLQRHGVPAGPMFTGTDQIEDAHFQARGYTRWLDQQDAGRMCFEGPGFHADGMSDIDLFQAPRLGEHTRELGERLLGLSAAEIDRLIEDGVLEVAREA
jgi:formyl-CoA transferase/succinyl-CoA--D-citramalate CoA-transferase